jgi:hypothetical protein
MIPWVKCGDQQVHPKHLVTTGFGQSMCPGVEVVVIPGDSWSTEAVVRLLTAGWTQRRPGGDGLGMWDNPKLGLRLVQSTAVEQDGYIWSHLSVSTRAQVLPTWEQVRDVFWIVHPGEHGYIVVAPEAKHVNLREIHHIWHCMDGPGLPDFTRGGGTI